MGALADALVQRGGYNQADALNAEKGPRASELAREFGANSSTGSNTGGSNLTNYFNQQNQLQQQAIQPAIQSLQSSIPNIQQNYQTQIGQKQSSIQPLTDRYKSLIDQIKGQGQTATNAQTVVTSGELGKRGIEGSSTLAGQTIQNAVLPIEQQTQSLTQQTGLSQEADIKAIQDAIANLNNQQNLDIGNVNTNIANLQSGAGQTAITQALAQAQAAQTAQTQSEAFNYQKQQDAIQNALAKLGATNSTNLTNAQIAQIQNTIKNSNNASTNVNDVLSKLGVNIGSSSSGGQTLPQAKSFVSQ